MVETELLINNNEHNSNLSELSNIGYAELKMCSSTTAALHTIAAITALTSHAPQLKLPAQLLFTRP